MLLFIKRVTNKHCLSHVVSYILMCIRVLFIHFCHLTVKFADALQCAHSAQEQHDDVAENVLWVVLFVQLFFHDVVQGAIAHFT